MKKEIIISTTIIALAIVIYGNYQFRAKQEQIKAERLVQDNKEREDTIRKESLNECFELVYTNYITNWNLRCTQSGKEKNCNLTKFMSDDLKKDKMEWEKLCIEKYK